MGEENHFLIAFFSKFCQIASISINNQVTIKSRVVDGDRVISEREWTDEVVDKVAHEDRDGDHSIFHQAE